MIEHPLTRYRKARGLTIDAFAAKIGASKATISRLEGGLQDPSFALVRRIIAETEGEISADDFVTVKGESDGAEDGRRG
jgi:transcriptional regulator with XRE-family HTH domain